MDDHLGLARDNQDMMHSIIEANRRIAQLSLRISSLNLSTLSLTFNLRETASLIQTLSEQLHAKMNELRPLDFEARFLDEALIRNLGCYTLSQEPGFSSDWSCPTYKVSSLDLKDQDAAFSEFMSNLTALGFLSPPCNDYAIEHSELDSTEPLKIARMALRHSDTKTGSSVRYNLLHSISENEWKRVSAFEDKLESMESQTQQTAQKLYECRKIQRRYHDWLDDTLIEIKRMTMINAKLRVLHEDHVSELRVKLVKSMEFNQVLPQESEEDEVFYMAREDWEQTGEEEACFTAQEETKESQEEELCYTAQERSPESEEPEELFYPAQEEFEEEEEDVDVFSLALEEPVMTIPELQHPPSPKSLRKRKSRRKLARRKTIGSQGWESDPNTVDEQMPSFTNSLRRKRASASCITYTTGS